MLVVLVVVGQVVVHDEFDVVDVDAASGDVGRDEHLHLAALEVLERAGSGHLGAGAVQRAGAHAGVHQLGDDVVDTEAGLHEHDGGTVRAEQLDGRVEALHRRLHHEAVLDGAVLDLADEVVAHRVAQVVGDELVDVTVEGGGPQHRLTGGRGHVEDAADVGHEPEVGHAVGFVDHAHLDRAEVAVALVDEVEQPARGGDDDRRALAERVDLRRHRRAAVHGLHEAPLGATQRHERTLHLLGELPRGHEHEAGRALRCGLAHAGHERDAEAERLARPGGGAAADVAAGEGVGEGDGLHGEGVGHAVGGERLGHARGHAEIGEGGGHVLLSRGVRRVVRAAVSARLQPSIRHRSGPDPLNEELHT
ncbi:unannotated protein [freshwater metagenome]|uniref:Unannotated protein n=1 Tax=freshwater metagenome TaxID=449393 RepID=A0A6J6F951_9ZZZZ